MPKTIPDDDATGVSSVLSVSVRSGAWQLRVQDPTALDVGTLNSWLQQPTLP